MDDRVPPSAEDRAIGQRARRVRQRRDLSLDVAAGLAGISKQYLSKLETGKARFTRRGLIEDLAQALSCSVADLTGQPYPPTDRQSADVVGTIPEISSALHDVTLDDVPEMATRPVDQLAALASEANRHVDQARFAPAGRDLGALLTELHVHAVTGRSEDRQVALAALVEACRVAYDVALATGYADLAVAASQRGYDAARLAERPDLAGLIATSHAIALLRAGARRRAASMCAGVLSEVSTSPATAVGWAPVAEARGMLHLVSGLVANRDRRPGDAVTHLAEARVLAGHTGERNSLRQHFGPTNVAAWELAFAVEAGNGPRAAERMVQAPIDLALFGSKCRESNVHFDLARAWAQAGGARDGEALRHLDQADRLAPVRVRNNPLARELVFAVDRRARRKVWELDSLKRRLGVT